MITAIDTNIVSALWSADPSAPAVAETLDRVDREGKLIVCGAVYAEMLAHPKATVSFVDSFLARTRIAVDFDLGAEVWREAGRRFAIYCQRRRRSGGAEPKRLLADFLVGAHALLRANRLFTLDAARYRRDFSEIHML
jgi:predicted nucleic acid-binding protein